MTIAIQGDWGSGKTSMMHLISQKLERDSGNQYGEATQLWFNTWQYSQFNSAEMLPVLLMQSLSVQLIKNHRMYGLGKRKEVHEKLFKFGKTLSEIGARIGGNLTGLPFEKVLEAVYEGTSPERSSVVDLSSLREEFETIVEEYLDELKNLKYSHTDRLVIFIDDLDRLEPERAVELMECMKVFLDCPQCVFVLAIDFEVVSRGVNSKYSGSGELKLDERKARAFFDKIIQVPYRMPIATYDIEQVLRDALGPNVINDDLLVRGSHNSVGTNPRSLKRLVNTFSLLQMVHTNSEHSSLSPALLFLVLAMQAAYPEFHQELSEMRDDEAMWSYLTGATDALPNEYSIPESWMITDRDQGRFLEFCKDLREAIKKAKIESSNAGESNDSSELLAIALESAAVTSSDSSASAKRSRSTRSTDTNVMLSDLEAYCGRNGGKELGEAFLTNFKQLAEEFDDLVCESGVQMHDNQTERRIEKLEWFVKGKHGRLALLTFKKKKANVTVKIPRIKRYGNALEKSLQATDLDRILKENPREELFGSPASPEDMKNVVDLLRNLVEIDRQ